MPGLKIFPWGRYSVKDPMVDIEKLLVDYAWSENVVITCFDKACRNRKYKLEVLWGYLDISHRRQEYTLLSCDERAKNKTVDNLKDEVEQRNLTLFRTEFSNSSSEEQTFTFKTERRTTSKCEVSIQRGITIGSKVDVQLSIPGDLCQITGGLSRELNVTETRGQTFEEELTWGVDSQIKVEEGKSVEASLLIREEELTAVFKINSVIRAVDEVIPIYLRDKKTNRVLNIFEIPSEKLPDILTKKDGFIKVDDKAVIYVTVGSLRAVYGAEQIIRIRPSTLEPKQPGDRSNVL